ncbi:MAG TPA: peptidase M50, partial [Candidatus Binatia bacterium]|nr:peptidase M50 [Candidatus Binatia bacterium]
VVGFIGLALLRGSLWYGALAVFMLMNCWGGLKHAQALLRMAKLPRRQGFSCPTCNSEPPVGNYWKCPRCAQPLDTFATGAACPNCHNQFPATQCLDCGRQHPLPEWAGQPPVAPGD